MLHLDNHVFQCQHNCLYAGYRNILLTDTKILHTENTVKNNSFPPTKIMKKKTYVIYQFKCPLGECISDN